MFRYLIILLLRYLLRLLAIGALLFIIIYLIKIIYDILINRKLIIAVLFYLLLILFHEILGINHIH